MHTHTEYNFNENKESASVCMHVLVYAHVWCEDACLCTEPQVDGMCLLLFTLLLRQGVSLNLKLTNLPRLDSQKARGLLSASLAWGFQVKDRLVPFL